MQALRYAAPFDVHVERRNGLDAQFPVVNTPGDGKRITRSDLVVVELVDGGPGIVGITVADVAVGSVGSAEFNHQSQFIQLSNRGKERNQLIFKTISWDSVAVDLCPSLWSRSRPAWWRSSVDPLAVVLGNIIAGPPAQLKESSSNVIGV